MSKSFVRQFNPNVKLVQIDTGDEEREEFELHYADGTTKYICSTNHDEDGWSGMEAVRDSLKTLADALDISFEIIYKEDDDD